jgi:hypothetical protein
MKFLLVSSIQNAHKGEGKVAVHSVVPTQQEAELLGCRMHEMQT